MSEHQTVAVARLVEDQCRDREQRVEPSAGLIDRLADEISRELLLKEFLILKRIVMLRKRHRAGVKPTVDHFRHTVHRLAALRTFDRDLIDVRTVQFRAFLPVIGHLGQLGA